MKKAITLFNGFCMALADSVPGVSGGTVAFLLGFYDNFIGALNDLVSGNMAEKKKALLYLINLGIGWAVGFILAVLILANMFESHIYQVSSLFIGFIVFAIPLVVMEEKAALAHKPSRAVMLLIGIAVVAAITYFNPVSGGASMDISNPDIPTYLYLFITGAIAICAMILPGISGSTLLLIFGVYLPIITAIKDILHLNFDALPAVIVFGLGVLTGVFCIIKTIKNALDKHRGSTIYFILGLMVGSIYAIIMGPQSLNTPQPPLSISSFSIIFFIIGGAVIVGMQLLKGEIGKKESKS